jgi:hypothetical protein
LEIERAVKQVVIDMDWVDLLTYSLAAFFSLIFLFGATFSLFGPEPYRLQLRPSVSLTRVVSCVLSLALAFAINHTLFRALAFSSAMSAGIPIALAVLHANGPAIRAASIATSVLWIIMFGIVFGRCMMTLKRRIRLESNSS